MNSALILLLITAVIGGGASVFIKIALQEIPVFSFSFLRFAVAGLFLLPLFYVNGCKWDKKSYKVALISLLGTANIVLFAYGIKLTSATVSSIFYSAVPIVATILSYFILKEKVTVKKLVGVLIGFIGTLIIIFLPLLDEGQEFYSSLVGNVLVFLAMLVFTLYTIESKKLQKNYSPLFLTTTMVIVSAVIALFFSIPEYLNNPDWIAQVSLKSVLSVLYCGIGGTVIYYLLYQYVIKHGGPVIASLTFYLQPITTFIWASFLLGETLTIEFVAAALLVFTGTLITTLSKSK